MTVRHTYLGTLVCFLLVLVGSAFAMPAEVPLHFGVTGDPDRWASRGEALMTMTTVGGLLALVMGGTAALVDRMPLAYLNAPHKDWWTATPERERRMRRMMRTDLYTLASATMLLLSVVVLATALAARADDPALGPLFFVGLACYLVFVVAWTVWSLSTRYRRRDDA